MKKIYSKLILLSLIIFPMTSCELLLEDIKDTIINKSSKSKSESDKSSSEIKDSGVLIGGKTLRQQINLKINKLELEEDQEIDFTQYIDLNQSILKPDDLVWSSKNSDIATIDKQSGRLKTIKEGTTLIVVSLKQNLDVFSIIELKVSKKRTVVFMKIIPNNIMLAVGQSKNLLAEVHLADGQINSNVTWSSSDDTIATVDQNGKVSAIKEGKVTITATYNLDNTYKSIATLQVASNPSQVVELPQPTSTPIVFTPSSTPIPSVVAPTLNPTPTPIPTPTSIPLTKLFKFFYDNDNKGYIITEYIGGSKTVNIPDTFDGEKVIKIKEFAFYNKGITSVTIPNSVTDIGSNAFESNQLTNVTIPNSVTSIKANTFANNKLKSVTIPNSVTDIGSNAFANNQLTSVTIPNSVTSIGANTFANNKLISIMIPDSVTSVGYQAFANNQLIEATFLNQDSNVRLGSWSHISPYLYHDSMFLNNPDLRTIKGYSGYAAEDLARNNGIRFVALDEGN